MKNFEVDKILDYLYGKGFAGIARQGCYDVSKDILKAGIQEYIKSGYDVLSEYDEFVWQNWNNNSEEPYFNEEEIEFWEDALGKKSYFNIYNIYTQSQIEQLIYKIDFAKAYWKQRKTYIFMRRDYGRFRNIVLKRDNYLCVKCKSAESLELDHILPLNKGGTNTMENLQILCKLCHKSKTKKDRVKKK